MKYKIVRTDKANDQFRDLAFYIARNNSVEAALGYLDKLETAILRLSEFPYSGVVPHYSTLKKQGYRVLIVERHLIFYKVDDARQVVIIYAVADGRMEYRNLL